MIDQESNQQIDFLNVLLPSDLIDNKIKISSDDVDDFDDFDE